MSIRTEIRSLTPDKVVFDVCGITVATANALRRICMSRVPTLGLEDVQITANTTTFHDEFLCHRIGFVPLRHTEDPQLKRFHFPDGECSCVSSCPRCRTDLIIECKAGNDPCFHMTSRHLSSSNKAVQPIHFLDGEEEKKAQLAEAILYPTRQTSQTGIRIAPLKKGEKFVGMGRVVKGTGTQHPRWSPAANCSVMQLEPGSTKMWTEPKGKERERTFRFSVELVGQLTAQELLESAFRVLIDRCKQLGGKGLLT